MSELEARDTTQALHINKPSWLKTKIPTGDTFFDIKRDLRSKNLFTVCEEAKCPNISECWATNTATFMVLGDTCTRACRFCNVKTGNPQGWLDGSEPEKTAESVRTMKLKYAVLTMVDRDDLEDGGAAHVKKCFEAIREKSPTTLLEFLGGDFQAKDSSLITILEAKPEVYAHNIETVLRLTPRVRDARASYAQSLKVLKRVKELTTYELFTKSAIMLGLGETMDEVVQALKDLREHDVDFITIGQYMRPSKRHLSIKEFVNPEQFDELAVIAKDLGFMSVASGPLVRSSYKASEFYAKAMELREELRR
ncbi:MAG: lipoyl synthase [Oligoflexus sp.]|nr:lipoyl synthase [Oligoflexus sp.]